MRVTYVLEAPTWGGAEASVVMLLAQLPDSVRGTVVAVRPVPDRLLAELPSAVPTVGVEPVRGKHDVAAAVRMVLAVRRTRPDLVHVNLNAPANNRYGLLAAWLSGAPSVATLHLPVPVSSRAQRRVLAVLYRRLDRVIAVSDEAARQLADELRVRGERIVVVPNGVPLQPPVAAAEPTAGRPVVVGAAGRLVPEKGMDVLLAATRQLSDSGVPVAVRIAGSGPEAERLRTRSAGLPVMFDGEVSDMQRWLEGLDVFCLPSRNEGLPLALLEAMMRGLPAVATDVGQVRTALGEGLRVVAPDDPAALATSLRELLADPVARATLGARGRAVVLAAHTAEAWAAQIQDVYAQVSRRRHRRRLHLNRHP
jgi:glycosyltransferase involved in cell wall biosynthesis